MVNFRHKLRRRHGAFRSVTRRHVHSHTRRLSCPCIRHLPGYQPSPSDLSKTLTAFSRAIRAHRQLARLAPEIYDTTQADRSAHRRKQDAEWRAVWEPILNEVYGPSPPETSPLYDWTEQLLPRSPRTRRVIEREYVNWQFWMEAGRLALQRYRQRRHHATPSLAQTARLIGLGMELGRLSCGSFNPASEPPAHAQAMADLERIYGGNNKNLCRQNHCA